MDAYLKELADTLGRLTSSVQREYASVPGSVDYSDVRAALLKVHEQISAAQSGARAALNAYYLLPDDVKAWRRRV